MKYQIILIDGELYVPDRPAPFNQDGFTFIYKRFKGTVSKEEYEEILKEMFNVENRST